MTADNNLQVVYNPNCQRKNTIDTLFSVKYNYHFNTQRVQCSFLLVLEVSREFCIPILNESSLEVVFYATLDVFVLYKTCDQKYLPDCYPNPSIYLMNLDST